MIARTSEEMEQHTEDMQDIISKPPSWLMRWGIMLFFSLLLILVGTSALIRYPDVVKTQLRVNVTNSPKPVVSKISGRIINVLVSDDQKVDSGQVLGYLESTADHEHVIDLLAELKSIQEHLFSRNNSLLSYINTPRSLQLGEMQASYQSFYQSYITYKASIDDGLYLKRKAFLQKDLSDVLRQKQVLLAQSDLQEKEHQLAEQEYKMHETLFNEKVESRSELRKEETKLLTSKSALQQISASLLNNNMSYSAKAKEISELDAQIRDEQSRFMQALSTVISEMEEWKSKYVLTAHRNGKIFFNGPIQKNQFITINQELFYINPGDEEFFGEMTIPQENMGKIKLGQKVLVKLRSYPFQEYGMLEGRISYISDLPYNDSGFISRVLLYDKRTGNHNKIIKMKIGMLANAEIITENASLITRIYRNIIKTL